LRRIELQLNVAGCTGQRGAPGSQMLKRLDAGRVNRHEVGQVKFERARARTRAKQFRHLGHCQPPGETHDASIRFLSNANPAIHNRAEGGKTDATPNQSKGGRERSDSTAAHGPR